MLTYDEQYRFNVVLEEYPRNVARANKMGLACGCVLVCEDGIRITGVERRGSRNRVCSKTARTGEYCWDDGEVVLIFEEIRGSG
jgi:hypothetical protein